jgi:hypothetical protein
LLSTKYVGNNVLIIKIKLIVLKTQLVLGIMMFVV